MFHPWSVEQKKKDIPILTLYNNRKTYKVQILNQSLSLIILATTNNLFERYLHNPFNGQGAILFFLLLQRDCQAATIVCDGFVHDSVVTNLSLFNITMCSLNLCVFSSDSLSNFFFFLILKFKLDDRDLFSLKKKKTYMLFSHLIHSLVSGSKRLGPRAAKTLNFFSTSSYSLFG